MRLALIIALATATTAAAEDPQITAYWNPYRLSNAEGCPAVPGIFFAIEDGVCVTHLPTAKAPGTLQGQPSYRFTLPMKTGPDGKMVLAAQEGLREACEVNPKVVYLRKYVGVAVTPGKGEVTGDVAKQVVPKGEMCRVEVPRDAELSV